MSFAIIETGGKQYRVAAGDTISVEKLPEVKVGDKVKFDRVLLVAQGDEVKIGTPLIAEAAVAGTAVAAGRAPKVTVIHFKAKSNYKKKAGHRQPFLRVKIDTVS